MAKLIRNPSGKFQAFDDNGDPLSGGKLYTYTIDTVINKTTYQDALGATPHANPIILDSRGEADIFWDGVYDLKLTDSSDVQVWTMDDFGQGGLEAEARTAPQATTWNMASDADYTLTAAQELFGRIIITDTLTNLTAARNIVCSDTERGYYFQNDTLYVLTLKTSAGTGVAIHPGHTTFLACDGTDVISPLNEQRSAPFAVTHDMASDANYTLTAAQEKYGRVIITDTSVNLTAARNIIISDGERGIYFQNDTAQTLTLKTSAGTGIAVLADERILLVCDGTNVVKLIEPRDISGYVKGTTEYLEEDVGADSTELDVDGLIGAAWESVGPTGSGAVNVWTPLDAAPNNYAYVKLKTYAQVSGAVNGQLYSVEVYARKTGSSAADDFFTQHSIAHVTNRSGSTESGISLTYDEVPVDSSGRFDLYYVVSGTTPLADAAKTFLKGWGI